MEKHIKLFGSDCCQNYRCWKKTFNVDNKLKECGQVIDLVDVSENYLMSKFGVDKIPFITVNNEVIKSTDLLTWFTSFNRNNILAREKSQHNKPLFTFESEHIS